MAKVNFSKVEHLLRESLQKFSSEELADQGAIANLINGSELTQVSAEKIEKIFGRFQNKLKLFKERSPTLYAKLGLRAEDEQKFFGSPEALNKKDWKRLALFNTRIDEIKQGLAGAPIPNPEDESYVEKMYQEQQEARFNIKKGWRPIQ